MIEHCVRSLAAEITVQIAFVRDLDLRIERFVKSILVFE